MNIPEIPTSVIDPCYFNEAINNATRLSIDAKLLTKNDRSYSAVMLSIFAIEELGKALIVLWGVKNITNKRTYPTHIEKQSATFALLSAVEIVSMSKHHLNNMVLNQDVNFHEIGPLSSQFAYARSGFFDDLRMAVTYADKAPKLQFEEKGVVIDIELAEELLGWFEHALKSIPNVAAMNLASVFFKNDLGRL